MREPEQLSFDWESYDSESYCEHENSKDGTCLTCGCSVDGDSI